jgi:hypothetical protein
MEDTPRRTFTEPTAGDLELLRSLGAVEIHWQPFSATIFFSDDVTIAVVKTCIGALERILLDLNPTASEIKVGGRNSLKLQLKGSTPFQPDAMETVIKALQPQFTGGARASVGLAWNGEQPTGLLLRLTTTDGRPKTISLSALMAAPGVEAAVAALVQAISPPLGLHVEDRVVRETEYVLLSPQPVKSVD